jgi:hypothetical protein
MSILTSPWNAVYSKDKKLMEMGSYWSSQNLMGLPQKPTGFSLCKEKNYPGHPPISRDNSILNSIFNCMLPICTVLNSRQVPQDISHI